MQRVLAREELRREAFLNALLPVDTEARELQSLKREWDAVALAIARKREALQRRESLSVQVLVGHQVSVEIRWEVCFAYQVSKGCASLATCYFRYMCPPDMQLAFDNAKPEAIEAVSRRWNESAPRDVRTSWRYLRTLKEQRARQRVHDFVAEFELWAWVQNMNSQRGYAPSSSHLIERHVAAWPWKNTPNVENTAFSVSTRVASKQRVWARNFRKSWGMSWGRLPAHDLDPPAEVQAKAIPARHVN